MCKGAGISYVGIFHLNNKWVHCENQKLSVEGWPKGAKGLYLAFYEQSHSKSKVPKTLGSKPKRKVAQSDVQDAPCPNKLCRNGTKKTSPKSAHPVTKFLFKINTIINHTVHRCHI